MPVPVSSSSSQTRIQSKKKKKNSYRVSFAAYKDVVMFSAHDCNENSLSASQSLTMETQLPASVSPPPLSIMSSSEQQQQEAPLDLHDLITLLDQLLNVNLFDSANP